jgi:hypothetical protein
MKTTAAVAAISLGILSRKHFQPYKITSLAKIFNHYIPYTANSQAVAQLVPSFRFSALLDPPHKAEGLSLMIS